MDLRTVRAQLLPNGVVLRGEKAPRTCCGLLAGSGDVTVSNYELLAVEPRQEGIYCLTYAGRAGRHLVPRSQQVHVITDSIESNEDVTTQLMDRAYGTAVRRKRILVLINPHSGPGRARAIYYRFCAPLFEAAGCSTTVHETKHRYHAEEIVQSESDIGQYDAIVCCSGDGTAHEVVNGLYKRDPALLERLPIAQLPGGSGNSLCMSTAGTADPSEAALCVIKGLPMQFDLMRFVQGDTMRLSFLSQAYGLVADVDLGSEHLRWMGSARFTVGAIQRMLNQSHYPADIYVKYRHKDTHDVIRSFHEGRASDSQVSTESTIGSTIESNVNANPFYDQDSEGWSHYSCDRLAIMYAGKMPWMSTDVQAFPAALPTDGAIDLFITTIDIGRVETAKVLLGFESGIHIHNDNLQYSKVEAYKVVPHVRSGYLSIDGEAYDMQPFTVDVLRAAGCLLTRTGEFEKSVLCKKGRRE